MSWGPIDESTIPFQDRESAAVLLAAQLKSVIKKQVLVLAIPRGGVVTGKVIAKALGAELDLLICKKVGHPGNPEYAIGSVCADGSAVQTNIGSTQLKEYFNKQSEKIINSLIERYTMLTGRTNPISVEGKDIIICDDGVATGSTILAAIKSVQHQKAHSIQVATPVISRSALDKLTKNCDHVHYLSAPHPFGAVGEFYVSFPTVNDEEVFLLMKK